ncbi:MAG TPA: 16S rRNA (guanine(966)-N(2))-methyltransferase RsmD [Candidatus Kapabacteria bacterium]
MRIISGTYRSRTIITPKGDATRPTTDRARESLFNILSHSFDLEGIRVLDLFAGSGAFGLESLSRGASHVTFVENDRKALEAIAANIKAFDTEDITTVIRQDVYKWLSGASKTYDLVFADPPYDDDRTLAQLPDILFSRGLLLPNSVVICEHRTGSTVEPPPQVDVLRVVTVGEAQFTLLTRKPETG